MTHKFTEPQLRLIKHVAVRGGVRPEKGEFAVITALRKAGLIGGGSTHTYEMRAAFFTDKMNDALLAAFPRYHVDTVHLNGVLFAPGLRVMCCREGYHGQRDLLGFADGDKTTPLQIIADLLNKEAGL